MFLLGEAPGGNKRIGNEESRYSKDYPLDENPDIQPETEDGFQIPPASERIPDSDYLKPLRHMIEALESRHEMSVYYSNVTKCDDLHPSSGGLSENETNDMNTKGFKRCLHYLDRELELIDPSVVVVFSKEDHLETMLRYFGCADQVDLSSITYSVFGDKPHKPPYIQTLQPPNQEFSIVPSYHFSKAGSFVSQYIEGSDENEPVLPSLNHAELGYTEDTGYEDRYFHQLAEAAAAAVNTQR